MSLFLIETLTVGPDLTCCEYDKVCKVSRALGIDGRLSQGLVSAVGNLSIFISPRFCGKVDEVHASK